MSDNRCVMCGTIIPEGGMVCPTCEKQTENFLKEEWVQKKFLHVDDEKRMKRRDFVDYLMWDWVMPLLVGGFILYLMFGRW